MTLSLVLTALGLLLSLPVSASAVELLIDTGPGTTNTIGSPALFSIGSTTCSPQPACAASFQHIGAQFTLTSAATLDSVEGWMSSFSGGSIEVKIRADSNGLPGTVIFSQSYTPPAHSLGWARFLNYNAILAAGTYWLTFEPVANTNFSTGMPNGAPNPLASYAFFANGNNRWVRLSQERTLGIRISGTRSVLPAFGTVTRVIRKGEFTRFDSTDGGLGELRTRRGSASNDGIQTASAMIQENGLTVGTWSSSELGTARAIAFRTFRNNTAQSKTFKVKAVLDGNFKGAGFDLPTGPLGVGAAVRVLNSTVFGDRLNASGLPADEFLLGNHTLLNSRNGLSGRFASLLALFPGGILGNAEAFRSTGPHGENIVIELATNLVTVEPQETFTVMFDLATFSVAAGDVYCHMAICGPTGYGSVYFHDSLKPASDFFVDGNGNAVAGIEALSPAAPVTPPPASLTLTPSPTTRALGSAHTLTALATTAQGTPIADAVVRFEVVSGPHAGLTGGGLTAANGQATFSYTGVAGGGTDNIRAWVGALGSNVVQTTWQVVTPVQFSAASYRFSEGAGRATLVVTRGGDKSVSSTVAYQTVDDSATVPCDPTINSSDGTPYPQGTAYARCDYATAVATVTFAPGEESKEISISLVDDAHVEVAETLRVRLFNPKGATLDAQSIATITLDDNDGAGAPNPILNTPLFVRMHYLDFLSREPEADEPWSKLLDGCANPFNLDPESPSVGCDRITVSRSFYGSPEFSLKGFYVFNFYRVAFGRLPAYDEIIKDMSSVTGQTPADTFAQRAAFAASFSGRQEFIESYATLADAAFVDALLHRYGLQQITTPDPADPEGGVKVVLKREDLTGRLAVTGPSALTRAQVLRAVVESDEVKASEFNAAFVAMQYYGYLRRTPEEEGYQDWLRVINQDPSNVRVMIHGFMNSAEYLLRFGRP